MRPPCVVSLPSDVLGVSSLAVLPFVFVYGPAGPPPALPLAKPCVSLLPHRRRRPGLVSRPLCVGAGLHWFVNTACATLRPYVRSSLACASWLPRNNGGVPSPPSRHRWRDCLHLTSCVF